jgi:hypothetical protein
MLYKINFFEVSETNGNKKFTFDYVDQFGRKTAVYMCHYDLQHWHKKCCKNYFLKFS